MTEEEVKAKIITPNLQKAGWDLRDDITMERKITDGEMSFQGDKILRQEAKRYDYCLQHCGTHIAIIEAKKYALPAREGLSQAMQYAQMLKAPFAYSSNGEKFIEHDFFTGKEREIPIDSFPSKNELLARYYKGRNIPQETQGLLSVPYFSEKQTPRYYQENAVNLTLEAIAKNQRRILLVMATGTGKTFTAFQIIYRLYKAKKIKKVLYLADRNNLIDQTMRGDFRHFETQMTKVENKSFNPSAIFYFSLYHQFISYNENEEPTRHYEAMDKDFFDLILIDECHRGSAREDSEWREILEYFSSAIQIGMTATPKYKQDENDNIDYFGEPVYIYSLKQGIEDGFLAPYKVIRYGINQDLMGYRPECNKTDKDGNLIPDKVYTQNDFNREIDIKERTELVAKTISDFLKYTLKDRFAKTIVFCQDQDHASKMCGALKNENSDLVKQYPNYIVRITSDDAYGKSYLDDFTSIREKLPVIATTSKLLTTGIDTKMVKVIAIDSNISSITEFKQIIGRGTRINQNEGKCYFVILDFKNATRHFMIDDFDPADFEIIEAKDLDSKKDLELFPKQEKELEAKMPRKKIEVDGVHCEIIYESQQILANGKLISNDFKKYSTENLKKNYTSLESFLAQWNANDRKTDFFEELENKGILIKNLRTRDEYKNLDEFDILLSLAFNQVPLSRKDRAKKANKILLQYEGKAREVLEILLQKYEQNGIVEIEDSNVFKNKPFKESFIEIINHFGDLDSYKKAIKAIKNELYKVA